MLILYLESLMLSVYFAIIAVCVVSLIFNTLRIMFARSNFGLYHLSSR